MNAPSLDQILRALSIGGEVRLMPRSVPLDELLMMLSETRFGGAIEIGEGSQLDRIVLREGRVIDVEPIAHLAVQLLARVMLELDSVDRESLRDTIAEDPFQTPTELGARLLESEAIHREALAKAWSEQARRRLFFLYERADEPIRLHRLDPLGSPLDLKLTSIDVLPAVAYGLVMRSDEARRRAILAYVSHRHVQLLNPYDEERNRCGLPPPLLAGARTLAQGFVFGGEPSLPGLAPDTTSGLLLLFQRMSLLRVTDPAQLPRAPSLSPRARPS